MSYTYIGYSLDDNIRYKASSGGIGSQILKYLFETNYIQSAISLCYNSDTLMYQPRIIYSFNDYVISGSVYHEIALIDFIRNNIQSIKGRFCCFALPCQIKAIRHILEKIILNPFYLPLHVLLSSILLQLNIYYVMKI